MITAHKLQTLGIGSLPHHNVDAALEYSFKYSIPFLPQIPIRNPWEYMIPQALEGLPGLSVERSQSGIKFDPNLWMGRYQFFQKKLNSCFENNFFEAFEPSPALSSCWQPFLWELSERKVSKAKVQIAGPMTCSWALQSVSNFKNADLIDFQSQISKLILARALAMVMRLRSEGIEPIIFIDEPALYAYQPIRPEHQLKFQELKFFIQALKKEGATVGLHCCSNTVWEKVLDLNIDILSIDIKLSSEDLFKHPHALFKFLRQKEKTLALGIIPTQAPFEKGIETFESFLLQFKAFSEKNTTPFDLHSSPSQENQASNPHGWSEKLKEFYLTPTCGLAFNTPSECEQILMELESARQTFIKAIYSHLY